MHLVYDATALIRPRRNSMAFSSLRSGDLVLVECDVINNAAATIAFAIRTIYILCMRPRVILREITYQNCQYAYISSLSNIIFGRALNSEEPASSSAIGYKWDSFAL